MYSKCIHHSHIDALCIVKPQPRESQASLLDGTQSAKSFNTFPVMYFERKYTSHSTLQGIRPMNYFTCRILSQSNLNVIEQCSSSEGNRPPTTRTCIKNPLYPVHPIGKETLSNVKLNVNSLINVNVVAT